jgi:hypothetical protein
VVDCTSVDACNVTCPGDAGANTCGALKYCGNAKPDGC